MKLSPTERFTSRVEAYVKYRPTYPKEIIDYLKMESGLKSESIIADIGSGTGILTKLFLDNGNKVYGIEPNKSMRETAENYLKGYKNFISINGKAEATTLEPACVDFIIAGQAFHWFEPFSTKKEFKRVARQHCKAVLIWNDRDTENDPFQIEYEAVLNTLPEYVEVTHKNIDEEKISSFFSPSRFNTAVFCHFQILDFESLMGRLLSSSYCPDEKSEHFERIKNELHVIFMRHQENGFIHFNYKTMLYLTEM